MMPLWRAMVKVILKRPCSDGLTICHPSRHRYVSSYMLGRWVMENPQQSACA